MEIVISYLHNVIIYKFVHKSLSTMPGTQTALTEE